MSLAYDTSKAAANHLTTLPANWPDAGLPRDGVDCALVITAQYNYFLNSCGV